MNVTLTKTKATKNFTVYSINVPGVNFFQKVYLPLPTEGEAPDELVATIQAPQKKATRSTRQNQAA